MLFARSINGGYENFSEEIRMRKLMLWAMVAGFCAAGCSTRDVSKQAADTEDGYAADGEQACWKQENGSAHFDDICYY